MPAQDLADDLEQIHGDTLQRSAHCVDCEARLWPGALVKIVDGRVMCQRRVRRAHNVKLVQPQHTDR